MNRAVELLASRLVVTHTRGEEHDAQCPAHGDRNASLTFAPGQHGGAVLHCHAGCTTEHVLEMLGMSFADISPEPHIVATYAYRSEEGQLLWTTERWEPKTFRQRGLPPPGGRVLYHSEWLPKARELDDTVFVVEGEKDCDTLAQHGHVAVCGVNGAGAWLPQYTEQLRAMDVIVVADADEPGKVHGRAVAKALDGVAERVSLMLPSYGKDISDQLQAGYDLSTLVPLSVEPELGIHRLDSIRERAVSWLWPGYLPVGKLAMIDGDPGDGKSVMTCDLAARFSSGAKLPDGQRARGGPIDVVMISAEDDPEDTIKPRLRVAGADQRRVHLLTSGVVEDQPFNLVRDLPALEAFVTTQHVGLIVLDPLMAFLPPTVDAYRDADVRRALYPLTQMAARSACTVLVIRHLVKQRSKPITAGGGSMGLIGAARVGFLVGRHPEDERKRVFACVKINIGPLPEPLGYKVASSVPGDDFAPPIVSWDTEPLRLTAHEVLTGSDDEEREARVEARTWLYEYLCANHTGATWKDIQYAGKREGHTEITLRRVRNQVAHMVSNPTTPDGTQRKGIFWVVNTVKPAGFRHLQVVPEPEPEDSAEAQGGTEKSAENSQDVLEGSTVPDETTEQPAVCSVCGGSPAVWFVHEQVRRCVAHNPMSYGGK